MTESAPAVSTRQAAELVSSHESSVKRWCNAGELACSYTPGGHRRIALDALLAFARDRDLDCRLLGLAPYELAVWNGLEAARNEETFDDLTALLYAWLGRGEAHLPPRLMQVLIDAGLGLPTVLDRVFAPVMHRVGQDWQHGAIDIGDEHRMTQVMKDTLATLRGALTSPRPSTLPARTALLGCVRNEMHELGALMSRLVLEAAGWRVVYLGADVPTEEFPLQQTKLHAPLMCVTFSALRSEPEAFSLIRLLASMYEPAHPYRLVLGGIDPCTGDADTTDLPFESVSCFLAFSDFETWLHDVPE